MVFEAFDEQQQKWHVFVSNPIYYLTKIQYSQLNWSSNNTMKAKETTGQVRG